MKNQVLSCLGRRKRESSQTEVDLGCGNRAGNPGLYQDRRVGKLPRDEVVLAAGEHRAAPGCFETLIGLNVGSQATQQAVNREAAAGSSDAGLDRRTGEVKFASSEESKPEREYNASEPPTRAMEDQPLGGNSQDPIVSEFGELTGPSSATLLTSDPDTARTLSGSDTDQPLDSGLSIADDHALTKMTKTECNTSPCRPKPTGDQNKCPFESQKDSDLPPRSPPGGQHFPGTIPKLIITRDPSPSRSQETRALLTVRSELSTGSCLEPHPDDESPCSDSGCGGSPALMRSLRKLSNSSSIGLSSASSFEESEDDFTGSDIESSLSPARSMCSPDDGSGVRVFSLITHYVFKSSVGCRY